MNTDILEQETVALDIFLNIEPLINRFLTFDDLRPLYWFDYDAMSTALPSSKDK